MTNIAIIGGGASGMFAAINLKEKSNNVNVTIYENLARVGKKLLATGNGRCNITNENACMFNENDSPIHYHGNQVKFANYALNTFSSKSLITYLNNNGLLLRKEDDKYYPFSEQAGTVLDFLRLKCEKLGVQFKLNNKINKITKANDCFVVNSEYYNYVIVATGGKSSPHLGTDGSGYKLLESFSHKCTQLFPAITQIKTDTTFVKQLKGIKVDAMCAISVNNELFRSEFGQVLFAEYGLSGPPIFQLSRVAAENYNKTCIISLDLMHDYTKEKIFELIKNSIENSYMDNLTTENLLSLVLNKRLGQVIIKYAGYKLNLSANKLSNKDISKIVDCIKNFKLNVTGVQGFSNAQVTAGGIETKGFYFDTMESKYCKHLYACGEVLDIDGDCGGYNLQWAFSSAFVAANAIYEEIK